MYEENVKPSQGEAGVEKPDGFDMAGCCGPMAAEMTKGCPWGAVLRSHRRAILAVFAVMILAVLISQVGGILGIIALLRTL